MSPLKETAVVRATRAYPLVLLGVLALVMAVGCARHVQRASSDALDESAVAPTSASAGRGAALFAKNCSACHGSDASPGPIGPPLRRIRERKTLDAIETAIEHPDPPMPKLFPGTLNAQDVADLAAYVETL
jgi:mono/diheme cytochrome c family protein